MKFVETPLAGAYTAELEPRSDERGFFARAFCSREFANLGLATSFVQANTSMSVNKGTLRGMHYQLGENAETKVVRCIKGAVYDVILDLRPDSATFGQHFGTELSEQNRRAMYVPKGFAHGFLTLEENSEVFYLVDAFYAPDAERGIRWDDPTFDFAWPERPLSVSERDLSHPTFSRSWHLELA